MDPYFLCWLVLLNCGAKPMPMRPNVGDTVVCIPCMHAGDTEKAMDPYFPFEDAVDVWARTFAALGIHYHDATMTLDL